MRNPILFFVLFLFPNILFSQTAYIQVKGEAGLSVFLNSQIKGITSTEYNGLIIENVSPGKHLIKIVKEGYTPFEEYVIVKPGEVFAYKVKPFAKHIVEISEQGNVAETNKTATIQTGKLVIQSVPIEIKISIPDIEGVQNSQKTKDEWIAEKIPAGTYLITFSFNKKIITKSITIEGDEITNVFVNMLNENLTVKNSIDPQVEQELITRLNKKMNEAEGSYRNFSFGIKYYSELKCYSTPGKAGSLTISYVRNGDSQYKDKRFAYEFKISQIKSIEINNPGHGDYYTPQGVSSPVGMIEIVLLDNSGYFVMSERNYGNTYWSTSPREPSKQISLPFLQSNKSNFDEIIDIFERLEIYNSR